jgi:ABC-type iron transport system FetAB ATPase subunit
MSRQRLDIRAVASSTAEGRVEAFRLQETRLLGLAGAGVGGGEAAGSVTVRTLPLYPRVFNIDEMKSAVDQLMQQSCAIYAQ